MIYARNSSLNRAFTLTELLVVIVVIAILAALLLGVLGKAKGRAQASICLNNNRQLVLAWQMYAHDNADRLVNNYGRKQMYSEYIRKDFHNWVNSFVDLTLDEQNTNQIYISNGLLFPYTGGSVSIYKCPTDKDLSPAQRGAGWSRRIRTYSLNGFLGPQVLEKVDLTASGRNPFFKQYRQFLKLGEIPNPAQIVVFVDEQPDSLGDSMFWINNDGWSDIPGTYHNRACEYSYADGHAAPRTWRSATIPSKVNFTADRHWHPTDQAGLEDRNWLIEHSSAPAE